jgi:hypothetical protein
LLWKSVQWEPSYSMCTDGWTDSYNEPNTRSSEMCEVPDLVHFVICKIFTRHRYVGWTRSSRSWEWRKDRSQLLWCRIAKSRMLQKWHKLMLFLYRISLEFKYLSYFCEAAIDCIFCTDTQANWTVPYCEQYYSKIVLVVWVICKCLRKDGCVLLVNWENW